MHGSRKLRPQKTIITALGGMILGVFLVFLYTWYQIDQIHENLEIINQIYIPTLKHFNQLSGKWTSYQRSFEQFVSFRKWGSKNLELGTPKLYLKKAVEPHILELNKILLKTSYKTEELNPLKIWLENYSTYLNQERISLAEIASLVKIKQLNEAALAYSKVRQQQITLTQDFKKINQTLENQLLSLQLLSQKELHRSQGIILLLLVSTLFFSFLVLIRIRQWFLPVFEWTSVAQEIAIHGIHAHVCFPKTTRWMPQPLALLTHEFSRMAKTILEREKTIQNQNSNLELLNESFKEQNEKLLKLGSLNERVLNSITSALLVIKKDSNGKKIVEQFNDRFCELFDFKRSQLFGVLAEEALSAWPQDVVQAWFLAECPLHWNKIPLQRPMSKNCKVFDIQLQLLSNLNGWLFLFEDITPLVEAEEKLAHAKKLVMASQMSTQVAHEVRNPLNALSLELEMLEEDLIKNNPEAIKRVSVLLEQIQRLDRITQRYLSVEPYLKKQQIKVEIHELLENCLRYLNPEVQSRKIQCLFNFNASKYIVLGDVDALSQVFFNLIRNACEAMSAVHESSRVLTITTGIESKNISVQFLDTGPGVSPHVQKNLFEPFVTNKITGHGMGLSLSRQICLEHGGELKCIPSIKGALFEVSLPLSVSHCISSRLRDVNAPEEGFNANSYRG